MTTIQCNINQSGTDKPLAGFVGVVSNNYLVSNEIFYTSTQVRHPLVNGAVSFNLLPSDIAEIAYLFQIVSVDPDSGLETIVHQFEAVVPLSTTPINLVVLGQQSGLRYDRRDASLLTLARFLTGNELFTNFLGGILWSNKGRYSPSTVYRRGNVVLYLTSSYQYIATNPASGLQPDLNPDAWALLVQGTDEGVSVFTAKIGEQKLFLSTSNPVDYLKCDGSEVSRFVYSRLFAEIGSGYGAGDGVNTFNLPDSPIVGDSCFFIYVGSLISTVAPGFNIGAQTLFLSSQNPQGYLFCDGSEVSRSTYSNLFAIIGTGYGAGDGATTFNLPISPITGDSAFFIYAGS